MTTIEQRLSRLEGVYDHLATKADLAEVKTEMTHLATKVDLAMLETRMAQMEARIVKWVVGTVITGMGVAAAVAVAVDRLLGG